MIIKFNLFESNFSTIRNYKPDTRNFGDNNGAELKKTFKMIYELEYKLHMMSVIKYIGTQKRKRILTETYEARLNDLLTTSLIMFSNVFDIWINNHAYLDDKRIENKVDEVENLFDQLPSIRKTYLRFPLKEKLVLFHKCLNQTHVNGSMLNHFKNFLELDFNFEKFLDNLSNNTMLHELWKSELSDMNYIEIKPKRTYSTKMPKRIDVDKRKKVKRFYTF